LASSIHAAFVRATRFERAKKNVPEAIIDFLQPDVFAGAADADVDPCRIPADAAVVADGSFL